jgi:hypothetical protein
MSDGMACFHLLFSLRRAASHVIRNTYSSGFAGEVGVELYFTTTRIGCVCSPTFRHCFMTYTMQGVRVKADVVWHQTLSTLRMETHCYSDVCWLSSSPIYTWKVVR